jgi:hypothetical protein
LANHDSPLLKPTVQYVSNMTATLGRTECRLRLHRFALTPGKQAVMRLDRHLHLSVLTTLSVGKPECETASACC